MSIQKIQRYRSSHFLKSKVLYSAKHLAVHMRKLSLQRRRNCLLFFLWHASFLKHLKYSTAQCDLHTGLGSVIFFMLGRFSIIAEGRGLPVTSSSARRVNTHATCKQLQQQVTAPLLDKAPISRARTRTYSGKLQNRSVFGL